jgi:hypothetical protein
MYWVNAVQDGAFIAEMQSLLKNLPLPRRSKVTRFNPFLEDGLNRLGGRIQCADLNREQQHPLLLDGAKRFTDFTHPTNPHPITSLRRTCHIVSASKWVLDPYCSSDNQKCPTHVYCVQNVEEYTGTANRGTIAIWPRKAFKTIRRYWHRFCWTAVNERCERYA